MTTTWKKSPYTRRFLQYDDKSTEERFWSLSYSISHFSIVSVLNITIIIFYTIANLFNGKAMWSLCFIPGLFITFIVGLRWNFLKRLCYILQAFTFAIALLFLGPEEDSRTFLRFGFTTGQLFWCLLSDSNLVWFIKIMVEVLLTLIFFMGRQGIAFGEDPLDSVTSILPLVLIHGIMGILWYSREHFDRLRFQVQDTKDANINCWKNLVDKSLSMPLLIVHARPTPGPNRLRTRASPSSPSTFTNRLTAESAFTIEFSNRAFHKLTEECYSPLNNNAKSFHRIDVQPPTFSNIERQNYQNTEGVCAETARQMLVVPRSDIEDGGGIYSPEEGFKTAGRRQVGEREFKSSRDFKEQQYYLLTKFSILEDKENSQSYDYHRDEEKHEDIDNRQSLFDYLNEVVEEFAKISPKFAQDFETDPRVKRIIYNDHESADEEKIYEMKISPLTWEGKQTALITLSDVSDKLMNEKLKHLDKYKDRVLSAVSHDFRTPLTIMIQLLDSVLANIEGNITKAPEQVQEFIHSFVNSEDIEICSSSANLLLSYVNDILDLAQFEAQKLLIRKSSFDLRKSVSQIIKLMDVQAKVKGLELVQSFEMSENDYDMFERNLNMENGGGKQELISPILPRGNGQQKEHASPIICYNDERRLKQVLINILGNAIKFTNEGCVKVSIKVGKNRRDALRIKVEDTGVGMNPDDLKELFKPYARIRDHEKMNHNGIGLGLMICKNLVGLMGPKNKLTVQSTPGKGTSFKFWIHFLHFEDGGSREKLQSKLSLREEPQDDLILLGPDGEPIATEALPVAYVTTPDPLPHSNTTNMITLASPAKKLRATIRERCLLKILAVDDGPFNLMALEKTFRILELQYNYKLEMTKAFNGQQAIDLIKKTGGGFDLILMDLEMPIMNGAECSKILSQLMKDKIVDKIPIIGLTAHEVDNERSKGLFKAGMSRVLTKPFRNEDLNKILGPFIKLGRASSM